MLICLQALEAGGCREACYAATIHGVGYGGGWDQCAFAGQELPDFGLLSL